MQEILKMFALNIHHENLGEVQWGENYKYFYFEDWKLFI